MRNRAWRVGVGTAVALATSVVTLIAGSTQAMASPDRAAGAPSSSVINIDLGTFEPISSARTGRTAAETGVTAFHGFSSLQAFTLQSQGVDIEGRITGKLKTHNFESLWTVYNLPKSSGWKLWVVSFKKDASQSVLKETFRRETLIDLDIDIRFKISANNLYGVSFLRIGFETLRLQLDGTTKDFTVVNGASGGAKDQDNNDIPVDFEPV